MYLVQERAVAGDSSLGLPSVERGRLAFLVLGASWAMSATPASLTTSTVAANVWHCWEADSVISVTSAFSQECE